ncbi:MAG: D-aminoacylase [Pseudomonadales bacterium]|jgi:N-acyl-D-amino-acid deacylase|nr:D-aminoacylase [Pseudomonadales bacterium]|tara:strand:- start:12283 stop:13779 length:1497 start_codon:yes stop_codon:yes gene_type:complete
MTHQTLVLRNAKIFDGKGNAPYEGDIGITKDRITSVGTVAGNSDREIDLNGLAVAPGFIDVHTHDDFAAILHPDMSFKAMGGVTSCVVGNCGMGAAPCPQAALLARAFHPHAVLPDWSGYNGYLNYIDSHSPSINIGALAGHGTIRMAVMGNEARTPTADEMGHMKKLLQEGLEAGVLGLSSGLIYDPGRHADTDELIELASIMEGTGALYTTHMRNEGTELLQSLEEAIQIGQSAGVGIQISHHKAAGRKSWGLVKESLKLIEDAQQRNIDVHADQYPYTAGSTILSATIQQGGLDREGGGLGDMDAEGIVLASTESHQEWEGQSIAELATSFGQSPQETAEAILAQEPGATVVLHSMDEDDVQTVMQHPSTMIGSDGIPTLEGKPHPRLYGSFARVLGHYSRDLGLFKLETAIHKMTGLSARKFGLTDRGELHQGTFADLVVFDQNSIVDKGTFADPNHYPEGIHHLFVNGVQVINEGEHTGARSGRSLRRSLAIA